MLLVCCDRAALFVESALKRVVSVTAKVGGRAIVVAEPGSRQTSPGDGHCALP